MLSKSANQRQQEASKPEKESKTADLLTRFYRLCRFLAWCRLNVFSLTIEEIRGNSTMKGRRCGVGIYILQKFSQIQLFRPSCYR
jgi:hypothetical protein